MSFARLSGMAEQAAEKVFSWHFEREFGRK